jgi:hypothetical protein
MATVAKLNAQLTGDDKPFGNAMTRAAEVVESFADKVNKITGKIVTPLERYNKKVDQLKAGLKAGAVTHEEFAAAVMAAVDMLDREQEALDAMKAAAAQAEEAQKTLTKSQAEAAKIAEKAAQETWRQIEETTKKIERTEERESRRKKLQAKVQARDAKKMAEDKAKMVEEAAKRNVERMRKISSTRTDALSGSRGVGNKLRAIVGVKLSESPLERHEKALQKLESRYQAGRISLSQFKSGVMAADTSLARAAGFAMAGTAVATVGVAAIAAAAGLAYFSARTAINAVETYKMANSIGVATKDIFALEAALTSVGGDSKLAGSALLQLSQNLQSTKAGNAGYAAALARIGLNARELANMPAPQALGMIADKIAGIGDATKRAGVLVDLFGDQAAALAPVLEKGAAGLAKSGESGKAAAKHLERLALVSDLQNKWAAFQDKLESIGLTIALEVIPYVHAFFDSFGETDSVVDSINGAIRSIFNVAQGSYSAILDINDAFMIFGEGIKLWALHTVDTYLRVIRLALQAASQLPGAAGRMAADALGEVEGMIGGTKTLMADSLDEIKRRWDNMGSDRKGGNFLDDLIKKADAYAAKVKQVHTGATPEINKNLELLKKAGSIFDEMQTPFEKFANRIEELQRILAVKGDEWGETFNRAAAQALNELDKAYDLSKMGFSSAVRAGTTEAYSVIVKSQQQEDITRKESPAERVRRLQEQANELQKETRRATEDVGKELKNLKVVKF